jgi:hypothetical protein
MPDALVPGAGVTLRPVFAGGAGRVEPGVGAVVSGASYEVGPYDAGQTFTLTVGEGAAAVTRELAVPFDYRGVVRTLDAQPAARSQHVAVLLADGRVLLAGGNGSGAVFEWGTELLDPATGAVEPAGDLQLGRVNAAAVRSSGGRVLLVGGESLSPPPDPAPWTLEGWEPGAGWTTLAGELAAPRSEPALQPMPNGLVLVTGGFWGARTYPGAGAEVLDPVTGALRLPRGGAMLEPRIAHTVSYIGTARVLIAGGWGANGAPVLGTEIYDLDAETFTPGPRMLHPRGGHAAVRLGNDVLLVGGLGADDLPVAEAERYDAASGTFVPAGRLETPRAFAPAVELVSGHVLVAGGITLGEGGAKIVLDTLERWDAGAGTWSTLPARLASPLEAHTLTRLPDGRVLIAGGHPGSGFPVSRAEVFE